MQRILSLQKISEHNFQGALAVASETSSQSYCCNKTNGLF
jgi:hypothetical protein